MTADRARLLRITGIGGAGLALAGAAALYTAYLQRTSIGVAVAVDYLRRHGVAASIRIDRLDTHGVSGALILGPRGDPDLSVDRIDVDFAAAPKLGQEFGAPRLRAVRLVRPRLKARFDRRRLTFGSLQSLLDEAAKAPASGPGPDVTIQDGRLELTSPLGRSIVVGDGVLRQGRIVWLKAQLSPGSLAGSGARFDGVAGQVQANALGRDRLKAQWRLSVGDVVASAQDRGAGSGHVRLGGVVLNGWAEAPYGAPGRLDGPLAGEASLLVQTVQSQTGRDRTAAGAGARNVSIQARLSGNARGPLAAPGFDGAATVAIQAFDAAWRGPGAGPQAALRYVSLALSAPRMKLEPPSQTPASETAASRGGAGATMRIQAPLQLAVDGRDGRATVGGRVLTLSRIAAQGSGLTDGSPGAMRLRFTGSTQADGGLPAGEAARLIRELVPAVADQAVGKALRQALIRDLRGFHLSAPDYTLALAPGRGLVRISAPIVARFDGGALAQVLAQPGAPALDLSQDHAEGALALRLAGPALPSVSLGLDGYRVANLHARPTIFLQASLQAHGDAGPLRGVSANVGSTVRATGGGVLTVVAQGCASAGLARYADPSGAVVLSDADVRLCPASAPLFALHGRRWTSAGRIVAFDASLPSAQATVSEGTAAFALNGAGGEPRGEVRALRLRLADVAAPARFGDLTVSGGAQATTPAWLGKLDVALARNDFPLGRLVLAYDPLNRRASARFGSAELHFTPKGLQPASVAPGLARLASRVQGAAAVTADLLWDGHALVSRGEVRTTGLDLQTQAGALHGLRGDLRFISLAPLISAPDQTLSADRLDALAPLSDLRLAFDLDADRAVLRSARATLADGEVSLNPMTIALAPAAAHAPVAGELRLRRVDLGALIKGFNLSNAVSLQARVSGELPFALGPAGLRLAGGRVAADGPGRLTIQRQALAGTASTTAADNAVQDFAYQALENLAFDTLEADVASRPQGRLGVVFHVKGRHDPASAPPTRIGLIDLLRGHAFDKPIPLPKGTPVDLTLDTSLNFDELLAAYGGLQAPAGSAGVHTAKP